MNEQEIIQLVAQAMAQNQPALPSWQDTMIAKGALKAGDAFLGGLFYLLALWVFEQRHRVGRALFKYADEVALDEDNARHPDPAIHLRARGNLARINAAKIHGFAVVVGLILAF